VIERLRRRLREEREEEKDLERETDLERDEYDRVLLDLDESGDRDLERERLPATLRPTPPRS